MKIVVAPDSFKSSLSSSQVIASIERGIKRIDPSIQIKSIPLADGGEVTVKSLVQATSGNSFVADVKGPLGEDVSAVYGILGDGETAVLEIASASGIELYKNSTPDPYRASTYGTGQLIKEIIRKKCKTLIIGLGGSATNDGGVGIASALGVKFFNSSNEELPPGGMALLELDRIDISNLDPALENLEIIAACDVTNALCGPDGASAIYGPQKGATPEMVQILDQALNNYSKVIKKNLNIDVSSISGAGAAGGAATGLITFCNASIKSGIDVICDLVDFEKEIQDADLIITGEGKIDQQTCKGKAIHGLALRARKQKIPLVAIGGNIDIRSIQALHEIGITSVFNVNPSLGTLEEVLVNAPENIEFTVSQIISLIRSSKNWY